MGALICDFKKLEKLIKPSWIYNIYHFKSIERFCIDSRSIKRRKEAFIAIKGKHKDGHSFIQEAVDRGAALVIGQKYIPTKPKVPFFVVEDTCQALGRIVSYIRKRKKPFVYGVTGSIGKTTVKEMLSFLLEPYYKVLKNKETENNILGLAKTLFCLEDEKVAVLELGTNHKGEIESLARICTPDAGIITCIRPVHLKGLKTLSGIRDEKLSLFSANQKMNPVRNSKHKKGKSKISNGMKAILNHDDPYLAKSKLKNKIFWFGKQKKNFISGRLIRREEGESIFLIQEKYELRLPTYREHFIDNALAAITGASLLNLAVPGLVERMNDFDNFSSMRMQMFEKKGYHILNDAYNANPHSFTKALEVLKNNPLKKIAVVADMLELGEKARYYHEKLATQLSEADFEYCLTFGDYSQSIREKMQKSGYKNVFHFSSHKKIADFINKKIGADKQRKKRYLIFLKGSRKMELENVIKHLR